MLRSRRFDNSRCTLALLLAGGLTACTTVGPNYVAPDIATPDAWTEQISRQMTEESESALQTWWTLFDDPTLNNLIERVRESNLDLQVAMSRIREARAHLAAANGKRLPTLDATAEYSRTEQSDDGVLEQVAPPNGFEAQNLYQAGLGASWEIDLFGRIRRSVEAAGDQYQATIEDERDVMVTLFAETALAYFEVRTFQQRILVAKSNIELQEQSLASAEERFESGLNSKLDVAQGLGEVANTRASMPLLEIGRQQALNRLAVLLGQHPGSVDAALAQPEPLPTKAALDVSLGVPADLLRQRPDIRRAERNLAAQTALIGVATADLYPSFTLTGMIATQTRSVDNLLSGNSKIYSLGTPIQWNLYNGGRIRSNIRIQEERTQQALLNYERAVLRALEEVENALVALEQDLQRRQWLRQAVEASVDAVDLVTVQYNTGLTDFNNVLNTQVSLAEQRDQLVVSEAQVVLDLISVYRSLGGGWNFEAAQ
jgi:multidrug efflux system outer membrane protein